MREVEEVKDPQPVKAEEPVALEDVVVIILMTFLIKSGILNMYI